MKQVRVALIGYGYWGPKLLRNLLKHPNVKVEYICDLSLIQLRRAKLEYPDIKLTQDFRDIIKDKSITSAVIAVPTSKHFEIARDFINSGKGVFIEKPMTVTVKDAEELVKLAKEKGVIICVDHPYIFSEPVRMIKSLINKNRLGKLFYYNSIRANLGLIDRSTNVFVDLVPHDLSILDYLLDQEQPEEIKVNGSSHIFHKPNYIENGSLFLKYKSGFTASIHLNWLSPIKVRHITIAGSKRMLVYNDNDLNNRLQIYDSGVNISNLNGNKKARTKKSLLSKIKYRSGRVKTPKIKDSEPLYEVIDSFVKAILYKKTLLNDGSLGLRIVKIIERINQSF